MLLSRSSFNSGYDRSYTAGNHSGCTFKTGNTHQSQQLLNVKYEVVPAKTSQASKVTKINRVYQFRGKKQASGFNVSWPASNWTYFSSWNRELLLVCKYPLPQIISSCYSRIPRNPFNWKISKSSKDMEGSEFWEFVWLFSGFAKIPLTDRLFKRFAIFALAI